MKKFEKYALLALSLILVSTYSISSALPEMRAYFAGLPAEKVDLLLSIPSFSVMSAILLNIIFTKYMNERKVIIIGLIIYSISGIMPMFINSYNLFLLSRICMGFGSGLVNTQAVSVISKRYEGQERATLLGYRGAVEALGNAALTMIAGYLLMFGWSKVFLIYSVGVPILLLYLIVIPKETIQKPVGEEAPVEIKTAGPSMSGKQVLFALINAVFCFVVIGSNSVLTMRIPVFMVDKGIGTDTQSSYILTILIVSSILSNLIYSKQKELLKGYFNIFFLFFSALGILGICFSPNMMEMIIAGVIFGFSYAVLITDVFQRIAVGLPSCHVNKATNIVLTGCNLGAFMATYAMKYINMVWDRMEAPAMVYSAVMLACMVILFAKKIFKYNR